MVIAPHVHNVQVINSVTGGLKSFPHCRDMGKKKKRGGGGGGGVQKSQKPPKPKGGAEVAPGDLPDPVEEVSEDLEELDLGKDEEEEEEVKREEDITEPEPATETKGLEE